MQQIVETPLINAASEWDPQFGEIYRKYAGKENELIALLQDIQKAVGYLPESALSGIAEFTEVSLAKVYGVATFYTQFRLQPVGKYIIRICRGTACHVKGSSQILKDIQSHLKIKPGETTADRLFTLETISCFGSCALAPVVVSNETVFGRMTSKKTRRTLRALSKDENNNAQNKIDWGTECNMPH